MKRTYTTLDVAILIPTRGRTNMLSDCVRSLRDTPGGWEATVLHDGEEPPSWLMHPDTRTIHIQIHTQAGYWRALDRGMDISRRPLIAYFANDCVFDPGWLEAALICWNLEFPDGLGLLGINDGLHDFQHCCHGITSRRWLEVLYGQPARFPPYRHHYGDSELTQFSMDLDRLRYCRSAMVRHLHPDNDGRERDEVDGEAGNSALVRPEYDRRYEIWDRRGRGLARQRLEREEAGVRA